MTIKWPSMTIQLPLSPSYPSSRTVSTNQYLQKMTEILTKTFQELDETLMKDKNNSSGGDLCSNLWAICVWLQQIHSFTGRIPLFSDCLMTQIITAFHMFVILRNPLIVRWNLIIFSSSGFMVISPKINCVFSATIENKRPIMPPWPCIMTQCEQENLKKNFFRGEVLETIQITNDRKPYLNMN